MRPDLMAPRVILAAALLLSEGAADMQSCLAATGISVIVWPWDNDYNSAKACRNNRIGSNPDVVVRATTAAQVAATVACAVDAGKQVKARSGAHGFENDACSGDVTIDLSDLDDFSVNNNNKYVSFGAGHTHGQLFWKLMQQNLVLPGGTEMTVGMGLWLGGGRGLLTSLLGLAVDSIREVEFVDAQGNQRSASASEDPDMFWAARGGGGEFPGIVTKFVAEASPMPNSVYRRECSGSTYSSGKPMLKEWTRLLRETQYSSRKMFTHITINTGSIKFDNLCFDCSSSELDWFNNQVTSRAVGGMYCSGGYSMSWEAKLRQEYGINAFLGGNFMAVEYWPGSWGYYNTGSFLVDSFENDALVDTFIDKAVNLPEVYIYQMGGDKICTDSDMAYNGCESKWVVHYKHGSRDYMNSVTNAIASHIPCKAFYNYMDAQMSCASSSKDAWLAAHFSDVPRLKSIKLEEDPYAVFKSRIDMATLNDDNGGGDDGGGGGDDGGGDDGGDDCSDGGSSSFSLKAVSKGFSDGNGATLSGVPGGFDDSWMGRGFNVVVLDPYSAMTVTGEGHFDMYDASTSPSDAMLSFLTVVPTGSLVVILAKDAVDHYSNSNIGSNLKTFMSSAFGATQFSSLTFRDSYGLVGYKGGSSPPLAEQAKSSGSGAVSLSVPFPCPGTGGTPSPTVHPVPSPTVMPTKQPLAGPSISPVRNPTPSPTAQPVPAPTQACAPFTFVGTSKGFSDGNDATLTGPDGFDDSWMGRGFNVMSFSASTNTLLSQQTFDTYNSPSDAMLSFLTAVPTGSLVVILAADAVDHWSGDKNIGSNLKTYMSSEFGASQFSSLAFRESYGLIGYKGESPPLAENVKAAGTGFVTLSVAIPCPGTPSPSMHPVPSPTVMPTKQPVTGPSAPPVINPTPSPTSQLVPVPSMAPVLNPTSPPSAQPVPAPTQACAPITFVGTSKGFSDGNDASLTGPDGFDDSWMGRGFNVMSFSATTRQLVSQQTFDTYNSEAESNSMLSFLTAVPTGSLVVILAADAVDHWSGDKNIGSNLKTFMSSEFGASQFSSLAFRESYGLIGYKGESPPLAENVKSEGSGFVTLSVAVPCVVGGPPVFNPTRSPVVAPVQSPTTTCSGITFVGTSKGFSDGNDASLTGPDGFDDSWMGRGFNVMSFSASTNTLLSQQTFDTYNSPSDAMLSFLTTVPSGSLVVILAADAVDHWSGDKNIGSNLKTYMSTAFGASQFSSLAFRESYGLIGYKGESPPLAENVKAAGTGFVTVTATANCS